MQLSKIKILHTLFVLIAVMFIAFIPPYVSKGQQTKKDSAPPVPYPAKKDSLYNAVTALVERIEASEAKIDSLKKVNNTVTTKGKEMNNLIDKVIHKKPKVIVKTKVVEVPKKEAKTDTVTETKIQTIYKDAPVYKPAPRPDTLTYWQWKQTRTLFQSKSEKAYWEWKKNKN